MQTTLMTPVAAPITSVERLPAVIPNNLGRDKVDWDDAIWERIDKAVHDEMVRTRVAQNFLPIRPVLPRTTSVPADATTIAGPAVGVLPGAGQTLTAEEGLTTSLSEYWVEFAMTPQQVQHETVDLMEIGHSTAVTLATRGANRLAQGEDLVIFQGQQAAAHPLFQMVHRRGAPVNTGLLNLPPGWPPMLPYQIRPVFWAGAVADVYAENTFAAVSRGISDLQDNGHYGPYALVLHTTPYADTYAPLPNTLILTADRVKPLMTAGFYGTGTLPSNLNLFGDQTRFYGLLVSLGGNTMDLVVGLDATTGFMQQDNDGTYRFRVVERFALRIKDIRAVIRMEFRGQ